LIRFEQLDHPRQTFGTLFDTQAIAFLPFTDPRTVSPAAPSKQSSERKLFSASRGGRGVSQRKSTRERTRHSGGAATKLDPAFLRDEADSVDHTVENTVFVIHGIRDDRFWTHRVSEHVRMTGTKSHGLARL
jgi:hypothetical protein